MVPAFLMHWTGLVGEPEPTLASTYVRLQRVSTDVGSSDYIDRIVTRKNAQGDSAECSALRSVA